MRLVRANQSLLAFIIAGAVAGIALHRAITKFLQLSRKNTSLDTNKPVERTGLAKHAAQLVAQRDAPARLGAVKRLQLHADAILVHRAVAPATAFRRRVERRIQRA